MDGHHAIFDLADVPTPLSLHAWSFRSLLHKARVVDQTNRVWAGMLRRDDLLHAVAHSNLIPGKQTQKLLKRPRRDAGFERDWLDTFSIQFGQLSQHIPWQMLSAALIHKTILKPFYKRHQLGNQSSQRLGIHARTSGNGTVEPGRTFVKLVHRGKIGLAL